MKDTLYEDIFLAHISVLNEETQDRYYDIIESLDFAISIDSRIKIDFEFHNLCDMLEDTQFEDMDRVFEYWSENYKTK